MPATTSLPSITDVAAGVVIAENYRPLIIRTGQLRVSSSRQQMSLFDDIRSKKAAAASSNPKLTLAVELFFYAFLLYVFILAAHRYGRVANYNSPSLIIFVLHWIFLYIHEGGHFLFSFFGDTLHILGGSFWQVMFPFAFFVLTLRDRSRYAPVPLFFTGFNLMAVSLYMRDATGRLLPLLGNDKSRHDWFNLFWKWKMLDSVETVADITYALGVALSVLAVGAGFLFALRTYFPPTVQATSELRVKLRETMQQENR